MFNEQIEEIAERVVDTILHACQMAASRDETVYETLIRVRNFCRSIRIYKEVINRLADDHLECINTEIILPAHPDYKITAILEDLVNMQENYTSLEITIHTLFAHPDVKPCLWTRTSYSSGMIYEDDMSEEQKTFYNYSTHFVSSGLNMAISNIYEAAKTEQLELLSFSIAECIERCSKLSYTLTGFSQSFGMLKPGEKTPEIWSVLQVLDTDLTLYEMYIGSNERIRQDKRRTERRIEGLLHSLNASDQMYFEDRIVLKQKMRLLQEENISLETVTRDQNLLVVNVDAHRFGILSQGIFIATNSLRKFVVNTLYDFDKTTDKSEWLSQRVLRFLADDDREWFMEQRSKDELSSHLDLPTCIRIIQGNWQIFIDIIRPEYARMIKQWIQELRTIRNEFWAHHKAEKISHDDIVYFLWRLAKIVNIADKKASEEINLLIRHLAYSRDET